MNTQKKDIVILSIVSVVLIFALLITANILFRTYSDEEMITKGKILCTQIINASNIYYKEHGVYLKTDKVSFSEDFVFDARTNPYFTVFSTYPIDDNKQGVSVFGSGKAKDIEIRVTFDKEEEPNLKDLKFQILKDK